MKIPFMNGPSLRLGDVIAVFIGVGILTLIIYVTFFHPLQRMNGGFGPEWTCISTRGVSGDPNPICYLNPKSDEGSSKQP